MNFFTFLCYFTWNKLRLLIIENTYFSELKNGKKVFNIFNRRKLKKQDLMKNKFLYGFSLILKHSLVWCFICLYSGSFWWFNCFSTSMDIYFNYRANCSGNNRYHFWNLFITAVWTLCAGPVCGAISCSRSCVIDYVD